MCQAGPERLREAHTQQILIVFKPRASLVAQMVKNPPAMRENGVPFLGWEDPLEEGMAIHSSILAWKIPRDREGWWATVHGVAKSRMRLEQSTTCIFLSH